jgi:hypothetical protein
MATLNKNWITEKHIDFEYKQYVLLAYLTEVNELFKGNKLYPKLSELIDHYKQLSTIKNNRQNIIDSFPKRLQQFNAQSLKLEYEKFMEDDTIMKEIQNIIDYSMPQFERYIGEGKKIYDFIEEQLNIFPVGVEPIHSRDFGYLLLKDGKNSEIKAYEYEIKLFEQSDIKYRGIYVSYIDTYTKSISNTMQSIKVDLIGKNKKYANPATYAIETSYVFPYEESFLPIAKRYLVKHIA